MAKSSDGKITIKKYANRRLYDTDSSSYITLDKLAGMIRDGRDFEVIDAKSGEDITRQVLTQIIVEEESHGETMLPTNFLRQLIGMYGGKMQEAVPQYLESAMDMFHRNQEAMRDAMTGKFGNTSLVDMAKRNMDMFQQSAKDFADRATGKTAAEKDEEVAKLKAELAALKNKVDKLGD